MGEFTTLLIVIGIVFVFVLYILLILLQKPSFQNFSSQENSTYKAKFIILKNSFPGLLFGILLGVLLDNILFGMGIGIVSDTSISLILRHLSYQTINSNINERHIIKRQVLLSLGLLTVILGFAVISLFFLLKLM